MSDGIDWKARYDELRYRDERDFVWEDRTRSPQIAAQRDALLEQLKAANETIAMLIGQNNELAWRVGEAFTQSNKDRGALTLERERNTQHEHAALGVEEDL